MRLSDQDYRQIDDRLADHDAFLAARYPGERPGRQPVHTVYVPAEQFERFYLPAQRLIADLVLSDDFTDFLTLPAYELVK